MAPARSPGSVRRALGPLAVVLAIASCGGPGRGAAQFDLLLVTIDTLRGDRWGCLGNPTARSPEMDRLARGGLLAFEGRAPAPLTLPAHASMMTGLSPAIHGVRDNGVFALPPDGPPTIAEVLRGRGWMTAAFVSAFPLARRFGLDRGFDHYDELLRGGDDDEGFGKLRERPAGDAVDRVARWMRRQSPDPSRPLFLWVHFFDPHAEYRPPAPWPAVFPGAPYDAEVAYVDRETGRLLDLLDDGRGGRARRVLAASDHGESLGEHGEATHGVLLHAATLRVPIVVRGDRFEPRLLPVPVPLESVARTALALSGVDGGLDAGAAPAADSFDGAVQSETLYPALNFGWRGLRAREEDGWKLILGARERLYRTATDPAETRDVAAEHPDVVERLRAKLERDWPATGAAALAGARTASPEETEALRSLGYLGGSGVDPARLDDAFLDGPDPSERIALLDDLNRGISWLDAGRPGAAESTLVAVVQRDAGNRLAWEFLGRAYLRQGEFERARATYRRALELGPNPSTVWLDLARAEQEIGDLDAAWRAFEAALAIDPRSVLARQGMSGILLARGDLPGATRLLEEAIDHRPRSAATRTLLARLYEAAGRTEESAEQWRKVRELEKGPAP